MGTKKTLKRKVTIDYKDCSLGLVKLNAEVVVHQHELDGSQTILLRTEPIRNLSEKIIVG